MKILFIVGSLRKESFNLKLANITKEIIKDKFDVKFLEYSNIPFMNQDIEFPTPKEIERIRNEVMESDALWIFTPEYNYQIPGVLKNLLDWLSRPIKKNESLTAVYGKKVTLSGAGGKMMTKKVRENLNNLLTFMKMDVMEDFQTGVAMPNEAFISGNFVVSDEVIEALKKQALEFIKFIEN